MLPPDWTLPCAACISACIARGICIWPLFPLADRCIIGGVARLAAGAPPTFAEGDAREPPRGIWWLPPALEWPDAYRSLPPRPPPWLIAACCCACCARWRAARCSCRCVSCHWRMSACALSEPCVWKVICARGDSSLGTLRSGVSRSSAMIRDIWWRPVASEGLSRSS